jgi:type IV pilus assembly protein PilQ
MKLNIKSGFNIKKSVKSLAVAGLAVFFVCVFGAGAFAADNQAANAAPIVITDIKIGNNSVAIKVNGPIRYSIYKPSEPYQIVVEIDGASIGQFKEKIMSTAEGITHIVPTQIESPSLSARLNIFMQSQSEVKAEIVGDTLVIQIDKALVQDRAKVDAEKPETVAVAKAQETKTDSAKDISDLFVDKSTEKTTADVAASEKPEPAKIEKNEQVEQKSAAKEALATTITDIYFDKDKDVIELIIKADGKLNEPAVYQLDGTVTIEITRVSFNGKVPVRMVAPVKDIKVKSENDKVRIVISTLAGVQSDVFILDDELLVDFSSSGSKARKQVAENGPVVQDKIVNGTKVISLDFQDADIVPILRLLGDVSGYNMVVHPDVKGKITMKLLNVPWTQALEIIIKTFNLEKVVEGNIIRIATVKAFQEEKKSTAENKELFGKAEDIVTHVFSVNNANVEKLKESIEKGKILSPRGTVSTDVRTRALIIKDIQSSITEVERLLVVLDKPTRQVLIEARIVEMQTSSSQSLGIEWGMTGKPKTGNSGTFSATGSQGSNVTGGLLSSPSTLFNLPAATSTAIPAVGAITLGYLTADKTLGLDIRLSAIGANNKLKILASPKILTLDNQEAIIKQGQKIPVLTQTPSSTGTTYSVTYIEATLKLTVTPQIAPGGMVVMKIELIRDEPNAKVDPVLGNPYIDIRLASTQVVLNDGETLVLGGIINNREIKSDSNVPGLSKLPLIGSLFKSDTTENSNVELLIFVTPRIAD